MQDKNTNGARPDMGTKGIQGTQNKLKPRSKLGVKQTFRLLINRETKKCKV